MVLAKRNYDRNQVISVKISNSNEKEVEIATNLGLLSVKTDRARFRNPEIRTQAIARYVAESLLKPKWDSPELLAKEVHNISRHLGREGRKIIGEAFVFSHNECELDFLGLITKVARNGKFFWSFYDPFLSALPRLRISAEHLRTVLFDVRKVTESNGAGGMLFRAVELFSENNPQIAETLYDLLVIESDEVTPPLMAPILSGLSRINFTRAHKKALELSNSRKVELARAGIIALSILKYAEEDRQTELRETLEMFARLNRTSSERKASTLATGYGNLSVSGIDVGKELADLSRRHQPQVQASIATVLSMRANDFVDTPWFKTALMNLKTAKPEHIGIIHEVDMTLNRLIVKDIDLVFRFLEAWITNNDYGHGTVENELPNIMPSTMQRLFDYSNDVLEKWITCWFNSNDRRLHQAAADISAEYCREHPRAGRRHIHLSKEILDECSEKDVIYILQKVLGYVILQGEVQSSLVFSILRREQCSEAIQREVYFFFVEYIAYNFPGSAMDYIRKKSTSGDAIEKKIAKSIIEKMDPYYDLHRELPRLKELEPPESRLDMYRKKRWEVNKRISELAHEKSVLLKLVTRIPLKYGKSFFFKSEGKYSDKADLSRITTSFEIPRGEYLDPVGQAILRFNWRDLAREIPE